MGNNATHNVTRTPDGLLHITKCERPIRYRDSQAQTRLILQDTCTAEPRVDLFIQDAGLDNACLTLDVARATRLRDALSAFLQESRGQSGWQYDGIVYDLDKAWEGRPGTGLDGIWFRHNDQFRDGVPVMEAVDPVTGHVVTLADVLGLQPCLMHGVFSAPCHMCTIDNVRELLTGGETADVDGIAYGEGFEPRGDQ
jgi:hypothetical protein